VISAASWLRSPYECLRTSGKEPLFRRRVHRGTQKDTEDTMVDDSVSRM
jgi:hypothetical protein